MTTRCGVIAISLTLITVLTISCAPRESDVEALLDPVQIDTGYISGAIIGDMGDEVRVYRGIPYAAPPVGDLRWKAPEPAASWEGIRECTAFGNSSTRSTVPINLAEMPTSEDCLYLNVMTPAETASDNLPVMVWMHGGGYTMGSGSCLQS